MREKKIIEWFGPGKTVKILNELEIPLRSKFSSVGITSDGEVFVNRSKVTEINLTKRYGTYYHAIEKLIEVARK